jgi:Asp-tRNA(Asn)/Glu-tRNA(Gln) amidotransferase A subunit family amidase
VRQRAISELEAILRGVDALLLPANLWVTPGRLPSARTNETPEEKMGVGFPGGKAGGPHIAIFNLTGHPAMVVALNRTETGLPIGVQIAGRLYDEQRLLRIASALERKSAWLTDLPELEPKLAEAG